MNKLPKKNNIVYLRNSFIKYKGLKIYGSPITVCRKESINKNYYSSAFETKNKIRA